MAPSIQLTKVPGDGSRGLHAQDLNKDPCCTNHNISNTYNLLLHCGGNEAIDGLARPAAKVVHSKYNYLYFVDFLQVRASNLVHRTLHPALQVYQRY